MDLPSPYGLIGTIIHMVEGEYSYSARGCDLPISNIKEVDGRFYIKSFMQHLNGKELVPITKEEYEANQH